MDGNSDRNNYLTKPSGLQTAWLLATLGSKMNAKKSIKREILQVSIPDICEELIKIGSERNIRYSSNILYGISLLYKSKINYFLTDISLIKTRLKKEFFMRSFLSREELEGHIVNIDKQMISSIKHGQMFLKNDQTFNVAVDLVPPLDWETPSIPTDVKRRKLEIREYDMNIFPSTTNHNRESYISQANIFEDVYNGGHVDSTQYPDRYMQTIDDFMDRELSLVNGDDEEPIEGGPQQTRKRTQTEEAEVHLDFEFNNDGEVVTAPAGDDPNILDDLDLGEINFPAQDREINPEVSNKNISNDDNFQISNTEHQATTNPQLQLDKSHVTRGTKRFQSLTVDENDQVRMSNKEMSKMMKTYDDRMTSEKEKALQESELRNLDTIVAEAFGDSTPFMNYARKAGFRSSLKKGDGKLPRLSRHNFNNSVAYNSIIKDIEDMVRNPDGQDEFEIGRRASQKDVIQDDLANNDINDILNDNFNEIDRNEDGFEQNSQEIFDISLDLSDIRSRFNSKSSTRNPSDLKEPNDNSETYFQEETVQYTLGTPVLSTQLTRLNNQLLNFFNFIQARSDLVGENFHSEDIRLSRLADHSQASLAYVPSKGTSFARCPFDRLIPSKKSSTELNESPISRKLAANSFSSILALCTRNLLHIEAESEVTTLLTPDKIDIITEV